jgi:hypothetical protein
MDAIVHHLRGLACGTAIIEAGGDGGQVMEHLRLRLESVKEK